MPETLTLNSDYGLVRSTGFKTIVKDCGNKNEQRISKSTSERKRYKFVLKERLVTDMDVALYQFFKARKGRYESFNITDPFDSSTVRMRFMDDDLSEEMFYYKLENSQLEIIEVTS